MELWELIDSFHEPDGRPFTLHTVTGGEVLKELNQLRSDCSTGVNQIPVGPLTHIINVCISTSHIPRIWKTARITPIPKSDDLAGDWDYRPVSILPALSVVFERLVLKQLVSYMDEQSLLLSIISGFRKGHSSVTVLLGICNQLTRVMSREEVMMMVCADFSKAFDTVKFKFVLTKLH